MKRLSKFICPVCETQKKHITQWKMEKTCKNEQCRKIYRSVVLECFWKCLICNDDSVANKKSTSYKKLCNKPRCRRIYHRLIHQRLKQNTAFGGVS